MFLCFNWKSHFPVGVVVFSDPTVFFLIFLKAEFLSLISCKLVDVRSLLLISRGCQHGDMYAGVNVMVQCSNAVFHERVVIGRVCCVC